MRKIACLPDDDRRELFRNTADKMGLNDAIVEKDFWVCFTLDYLFHRCPWKDSITFKGGTSCSCDIPAAFLISLILVNYKFHPQILQSIADLAIHKQKISTYQRKFTCPTLRSTIVQVIVIPCRK